MFVHIEIAAKHYEIRPRTLRDWAAAGKVERIEAPEGQGYWYWIPDGGSEEGPEGRIRKAIVISDTHVPSHHKGFWRATLDFAADFAPDDFVINGDFADLEAMSSHGGNPSPPKLREELEPVGACLDELGAVLPGQCRKRYLEGNHEKRLTKRIVEKLPALHGCFELRDLLDLEKRGWEWSAYMRPISLGLLDVLHGDWCGKNYAAKYLRDRGARPGGGLLIGHVHRPQTVTKHDEGGYRWMSGGGHGMDMSHAGYMNGRKGDWVMGLTVVYYGDDGAWNAYPVLAPHGSFIWDGKQYG